MRQEYTLGNISYGDLAKRYDLSRSAVSAIIKGRVWLDHTYTYQPRVLTAESHKNSK